MTVTTGGQRRGQSRVQQGEQSGNRARPQAGCSLLRSLVDGARACVTGLLKTAAPSFLCTVSQRIS